MKIGLQFAMVSELHALPGAKDLEPFETISGIPFFEISPDILACAGGISKVYFPEENRLERVPNVSNYEIYIERLDEMLDRKENNLFKEVTTC